MRTCEGRRNCAGCGRWRYLIDYRPYFSKKRNKEYLRKTCEFCCKRKDLDRYYNFSSEQKDRMRERTREYAAARRRREGKPVRDIHKRGYGSGRCQENTGYKESLDPLPLMKEAKRLQWNTERIALEARSDSRRVRDWKSGRARINIDSADRLCLALGTHLTLVY
jgi:hypothetical protein